MLVPIAVGLQLDNLVQGNGVFACRVCEGHTKSHMHTSELQLCTMLLHIHKLVLLIYFEGKRTVFCIRPCTEVREISLLCRAAQGMQSSGRENPPSNSWHGEQ